MRAGIALIPEDRQRAGLATACPSVTTSPWPALTAVSRFGFLNHAAERASPRDYTARLRIRAASGKQLAGRLSGGNQQKVAIAKWLVGRARDFSVRRAHARNRRRRQVEVFEMMDELARGGAAILMVSSEMAELLQVADRILVMRQGRISGELPGRTHAGTDHALCGI